MSETKKCKQCNQKFIVEDDDLLFYKKISPTFDGKVYEIPSPTFCPECREIRRLIWRNDKVLYKNKSSKSGIDIVSTFSPDKKYLVYSASEWHGDSWDGTQYAQDYDPNKSFFEQFNDLYQKVPHFAVQNLNNENCEYANYIMYCKNCYMSYVCFYNSEDVLYSYVTYTCKQCSDCLYCEKCEKCFKLISSNNCYNCNYSIRLSNCHDCYYSIDLIGCSDCLFCSNLKQKQFFIRNKQYSKKEYEKEKLKYNFGSYSENLKYCDEFTKLRENTFVKFASILNCENCEGHDLKNSKNIRSSFAQFGSEDIKYSLRTAKAKNCQDVMGGTLENSFECIAVGFGANYLFCGNCEESSFLIYCLESFYSHNCFGCVGLKHKEYCILNKQYTKEEYEKTVSKIIEKMRVDGEWGQFFPMNLSPYCYNETVANLWFPKTHKEAVNFGTKWQDNDFSIKYDGQFYEPKDNISDYHDNENERKNLLAGVLKCEVSDKPFKVTSQELAFYLENNVPIPKKHYDVRFQESFSIMNPRHLWKRQCMCEESGHGHPSFAEATEGKLGRCKNEFKTTYAPDRPEKVYCEACYQKSIL